MVRLSSGSFNAFLNGVGQKMGWRRAFACPCINLASGAALPGCPVCDGKGRAWAAQVEGMAGVAGMKVQRDWAQFGLYEDGDTVVTIGSDSPLYEIGQFDRVAMLNSSQAFSANYLRGEDALLFVPLQIDRVFWIEGESVVEGSIPAINLDGTLAWGAGAPPLGVVYSMSGRRRPEYFCFNELSQDRAHHGGSPLPRRVVLRKFDLLGR